MECYSAIKRNEIPFVATPMDREIIILSKVSQTEKDKYHTMSLTYGMFFKNDTIELTDISKAETDSHKEHLWLSKGIMGVGKKDKLGAWD